MAALFRPAFSTRLPSTTLRACFFLIDDWMCVQASRCLRRTATSAAALPRRILLWIIRAERNCCLRSPKPALAIIRRAAAWIRSAITDAKNSSWRCTCVYLRACRETMATAAAVVVVTAVVGGVVRLVGLVRVVRTYSSSTTSL